MKIASELAVPGLLLLVTAYSLLHGKGIFSAMTLGGRKGLKTVAGIIPSLAVLLPCIYMLRASGALDVLCRALQPLLSLVGIPSETAPLVLLRPLSGSGALAVGSEIMQSSGVDSFVGRCAAVMLGSTETTFYVIAVYFGAAGIKNSRHATPAALVADAVGFISAAFFVRLFWGSVLP